MILQKTMKWYSVYCYLNGLCYLGVIGTLIWCASKRVKWANEFFPAHTILQMCILLALMFGMFAGVCFWLPSSPRNKTWWTIHLINNILGVGSCIFTPLCLWLLVQWLKEEIKDEFKANGSPVEPPTAG